MSSFRKMLFAVAAVASFFGSSTVASAQTNPFVCSTTFTPLVVRVEGLRELVGDIIITCTGGNNVGPLFQQIAPELPNVLANGIVVAPLTAAAGTTAFAQPTVPAINISVTVPGAIITNRIFGGTNNLTDALLFIDDPDNASPTTATTFNAAAATAATRNQNPCTAGIVNGITTNAVCTQQSYFFSNGLAIASGYPNAAPLNVYQGQYGIGGGFVSNPNTVTFVGVPIVQPGLNNGNRVFRIKNIRVQVANSFQVNGQIQAFITVQNPPANWSLNNSQGLVGFVQQGLVFQTTSGGPYAQCLGFNLRNNTFPAENDGRSVVGTGLVSFIEGYGVAFKRRGFGGPLDVFNPINNQFFNMAGNGQTNPTANYNNESGFYNRLFPTTNGLDQAGIASQGTRLRARFVGIPMGVRLYVSAQPVASGSGCSAGTAAGRIGRDAANTRGFCAGSNGGINAPSAAFALDPGSLTANGDNTNTSITGSFAANTSFVLAANAGTAGVIDVQGGTAAGWSGNGAAYGALNRTTVQMVRVPTAADGTGVAFWEVLRAEDNITDRFDFLVAAAFVPTTSIITDTNTASSATASGNFAPIATVGGNGFPSVPSFILTQPERLDPLFSISNCATNLLYPFVSSVTGFNTGIAVTNASKDPFGTINESGICRVFFYGTTAGGGIDPTPQSFTKSVPSGQVAAFNLLFGGPEYGIQPVVGFQGYVIISCNFRWAHGFAFVSDPSNLQTAHGYLALILDPDGSLRRNTGSTTVESLDN